MAATAPNASKKNIPNATEVGRQPRTSTPTVKVGQLPNNTSQYGTRGTYQERNVHEGATTPIISNAAAMNAVPNASNNSIPYDPEVQPATASAPVRENNVRIVSGSTNNNNVPNAPSARKDVVVMAKGDYVGATFDDLVISVINYNSLINKAHLIKERKPKRIGIICSGVREEACDFKAYASKTAYGIRITTFEPHSCTGGPNRRQFNSSVIANIAPINFHGNIRTVQELVRDHTGFNVSSGQAHRIIHKNRNRAGNKNTPKDQGELARFLQLLKKEDTDGTYTQEIYGAERHAQHAGEFRRCFIVPSGILKSMPAYNRLVSVNFSELANGMQLLLLTAHDSNNEITLLGFAICRNDDAVANADNWAWFVRNAMEAMPNLGAIISAEVSAFNTEQMRAILSQRNVVHLWCSSHIIEQEIYPAGLNSRVGENLLSELMKARTSAHKNSVLKGVSDERFLEWWASVEDKCATYKLLDTYGCHRLGKIYSNTIEELGAPGDLEDKSAINVIVALIEHMSQVGITRFRAAKQHSENKRGYFYTRQLTPYAAAQLQLVVTEARTLHVVPELRDAHDAGTFRCTVSGSERCDSSSYRVTLKEGFKAHCECRYYEEFLRPCAHIAAAITEAVKVTGNAPEYDPWRPDSFHAFWTNENLLKQHLNVVKSLKEEGSDELMKLPKKIRRKRKRNYEPSTKNPRKCKRCGETGHFAITCQRTAT